HHVPRGPKEQGVAKTELVREPQFPREVIAIENSIEKLATLHNGVVLFVGRETRQERWRPLTMCGVHRNRDRQPPRYQAERRVEADVVHRAGHGFQPDRSGLGLLQPADPRSHDTLPHAGALEIGSYGQRTHPPFASRAVDDVEGRDLAAIIAPEERAAIRVGHGILPDGWIEVRHPYTGEPVAPVPLGEAVGKDAVQRGDVGESCLERSLRHLMRPPVAGDGHQSGAPAFSNMSGSSCTATAGPVPSIALTTDAPLS